MSYFVENNGSKVSLYFSSTKYFKMCWHIKNFFSSMKLFLVLSAIQNNIFWEWKKMNKGVILSEVSGRVYQPIKTQPFIAYAYPNSLVCPRCVITWMKSKTILPQCNMKLETVCVATKCISDLDTILVKTVRWFFATFELSDKKYFFGQSVLL